MKILILRFSSMGDTILVTPLFSYIKKEIPDAQLFFVTNRLYADLFRKDPRLSSVIAFDKDKENGIFSELADLPWDLVIDLQNNRRSHKILKKYFRTVPNSSFNKLHFRRLLLLLLRINTYSANHRVVQRYIRASTLPVNVYDLLPPVSLTIDDKNVGATLLSSEGIDCARPILALFPFCSWRNKQWSLDNFAAVAKHFLQKQWQIIVAGGHDDTIQSQLLVKKIDGSCGCFVGKLNLYEMGCVLQFCAVALGGDTGLTHLARACGVKTGIIYGATTWHFGFFPYGFPAYKIFQASQFCRPCHPHGGNFCWRISRPCLCGIPAAQVIDGMEMLIMES